jgi:PAS domain S-box-containing protein
MVSILQLLLRSLFATISGMNARLSSAYQQRMQRLVFRIAAIACLLMGSTTLLLTLLVDNPTRLPFALSCLVCAGVVWQGGRWVQQGQRTRLAVSVSILALLLLASQVTIMAPTELPGAGIFIYLIVLQFSARVDRPGRIWLWCSVTSLFYMVAITVRLTLLGFSFDQEPVLTIVTYLFPPLLFFLYSLIGVSITHQLTETEEKSLGLAQNLQDRTSEYQRLLQTMNEGFVIIDEDDTFRFVNDKFCQIVGIEAHEILDQPYEAFFQQDPAALSVLQAQSRLRRRGERSAYELQGKRPDGREITILISAMPNFDAAGVYRGSIALVMDITARKEAEAALQHERTLLSQRVAEQTARLLNANAALERELTERKQVEEALRAAEEEYRILFDQVPLGIYRSSPDGRQLRANPALVKLNGYTTEAEMLAAVDDIATEWYVNPKRRAEFIEALERDNVVRNFESEIYRHKTRERIWIAETAMMIRDERGQALYYQGTVEDITTRKQAEFQQERLVTELARLAQAKDEFLASMSHELRTPLGSILNLAELLREQIYGPLNERQQHALATVEASGQHLLSLINDILDLAKIEAGKTELTRKALDIDEVCQASIRFVQAAAHKKQLRVYFTPDANAKCMLADELRLKQMLINLLSNAVKFTPARGAVGLEVQSQRTDEPLVRFVVWDTGVGIPQEALGRLFQPFTQIDSRLARHHEGTGLGLALVQRMATMHGGTVTVESEVERGSRFIITLPWQLPDGAV